MDYLFEKVKHRNIFFLSKEEVVLSSGGFSSWKIWGVCVCVCGVGGGGGGGGGGHNHLDT